MNPSIDLSVIVPCYNEAENIPTLLQNFHESLKNHPEIELILVDNGSQDRTGAVIDLEITNSRYAFVRKVTVEKNLGYGHGILQGLAEARGGILAWTHADLQTDPGDILTALEIYRKKTATNKNCLVKAHRKNRKLGEKIFSLGMQILASLVLGVSLTEINAQPKLFPRSLFEKMKNPPEDFSLDLYLLYLAKKEHYSIHSFPVYFNPRVHGQAKGGGGTWQNRLKLIRRTVAFIFALRSRVAAN